MTVQKKVEKVSHILVFCRPKSTNSVHEASVPRYPNGKTVTT